jgi:hypothetical protein
MPFWPHFGGIEGVFKLSTTAFICAQRLLTAGASLFSALGKIKP